MNKIVPIGLGAAAVVRALVIGSQLLGPAAPPASANRHRPSPRRRPQRVRRRQPGLAPPQARSSSPAQTPPCRSRSTSDRRLVPIPGFRCHDEGRRQPRPAGQRRRGVTGVDVAGRDRVRRVRRSLPVGHDHSGDVATTPEEIAAAFAAQASSDATPPVDVTVGGFAGKSITLKVPMSYDRRTQPVRRSSPTATTTCSASTEFGGAGSAQRPGSGPDRRAVDPRRERIDRDPRCGVQSGYTGRSRRRVASPRRIGHLRVVARSFVRDRPEGLPPVALAYPAGGRP